MNTEKQIVPGLHGRIDRINGKTVKLGLDGNFCLYPRTGCVVICNYWLPHGAAKALGLETGIFGWASVGKVDGYSPKITEAHKSKALEIFQAVEAWEVSQGIIGLAVKDMVVVGV